MREEIDINLSDKEKLDRLRLIRSQHVGPVTFHQLLSRFGTATAALDALPELARRGGRTTPPRLCSAAQAEKEMAAHEAFSGHMVFWGEAAYPPRLAVITDAPPVLSVIGHLPLLTKKAVAVVGARNASTNGRLLAEQLAEGVGSGGYLVVSGMARGIDAAAHRGAVETGTVAVLGGGVDVVYPHQNRQLYETLCQRAALVSEVRPGTQPRARHFPRRNRIISGMARGVVVVEASPRSGSLITARLAGEQGREVFAVPGAAQDPRSRGANALIRDGAVLTETAADVLAVLDGLPQQTAPVLTEPKAAPAEAEAPADLRDAVMAALGTAPTARDNLVRQLAAPAASVAMVLLELELAGRLERHPGNQVSLLPDG